VAKTRTRKIFKAQLIVTDKGSDSGSKYISCGGKRVQQGAKAAFGILDVMPEGWEEKFIKPLKVGERLDFEASFTVRKRK